MTRVRLSTKCAAALAIVLSAWALPAGTQAQEDFQFAPDRAGDAAFEQEGVETLTRGPVHEAFGAPTANDPQPTQVVNIQPPEPINEEAPEYKPEGAIWIPGYWDWDVATSKHIWISGMWRVPPPGMRWVPPYWAEVSGGWQRVPGFWVSNETTEIRYQAELPESLEVGPSTPSPGNDYFYVPGTWTYDNDYRWRAGYWAPYRDDYVWCPDRWYWTPRGYIYTAGFWDWQPAVRGQLFAPIAFTSAIYSQPGFYYRPWCVIDTARFFTHLWIGPHAHCYYFGNYYGPWANRWGFTPWSHWRYGWRGGFYDPIWSWAHTHYDRRGVDFIGRTRGWHDYYARNEAERPARTFAEQRERIASGRIDRERAQNILGANLREIAERKDSPLRLSRLDDRQRESVRRLSEEIRDLNRERRRLEAETGRLASRDDRPDRDATDRPGAATGRGRGSLRLPQVSQDVREAVTGRDEAVRPDRSTRGPGEDRPTGRQPPRPDVTRPDRTARTDDAARPDRPERPQRPDRPTQPERPDRPALPDTSGAEDRPERPERPERPDRPDRPERPTQPERPDRPGQPDVSGPQAAPRTEAPRVETPRTETPRTPRTEAPRTETPRTPRIETQRPELPDRPTPRVDSPRTETPRVEAPRTTPRVETPRDQTPRTEVPRATPRVETPRVETPRVETPRVETPRTSRVETPRPSPRVETPRPTPRVETPPVETPRPSPRVESSRPPTSRAAPRSESPRVSTAPRDSSKGRSRDRDD